MTSLIFSKAFFIFFMFAPFRILII